MSADSTTPVPGVAIVLEDSVHRPIARTLSSPNGAFAFREVVPGVYRVRTLRIGFRPGQFGPYRLAPGTDQEVLLALRDLPTNLAAVHVEARSACRSAGEGGDETLAVWEEARTALLLTVLARTHWQPSVVVANYERVIDPRTGRIVRQTIQRRVGASSRPYVSALVPEEFAERGYVERDSSGATYRAPDADVLLAESFAATHCFQLVASAEEPRTIGLSFRPTSLRADLVDVTGTLWLDRTSSALQRLEFRYAGGDATQGDAGGTITFVTMPGGMWMIDRWRITVPRTASSRRFESTAVGELSENASLSSRPVTRRTTADVWEFGGQLASVRMDSGVVWRAPLARLHGIVHDAGSGEPVSGAVVSLRGTGYRARSDSLGQFVLDEVLPGRYDVDVISTTIASLGLDGTASAPVDLHDTATMTIALRTPSVRDALARACPGVGHPDSAATNRVLQGVVRLADGTPVSNAVVRARWLGRVDLRGSGVAGVSAQELRAETTTNADGLFRVCGLDRGRPVRLTAIRDSLRGPLVVAHLSDTALVTTVDLSVAPAGSSTSMEEGAGIDGIVTAAGAAPLGGVDVEVLGVATTRTDSTGAFHLRDLPAGSHLLRFRRIGLEVHIESVSLEPGQRVTRDVQMTRAAQMLAEVVVREAIDRATEARRGAGHGAFVTESDIERMHATRTDQLLRTIPGLRVEPRGGAGVAIVADRGVRSIAEVMGKDGRCDGVQVLIDNVAVAQPFDPNQIPPASIRLMEFYQGPATTPAALRTSKVACGTLAIWTR